MRRRFLWRLKFELERFILRGMQYRLLVIAALLGVMAFTAGIFVYLAGAGFGSLGEAVWWAFLRLSDPGYLGDDEGVLLRTVSTVLTVLGFVVFVGALVAILTQWLNQTIRELESGLTPISQNGHVLILGWTNRSAVVVRELLLSEGRVRRFLRRHHARSLHLVILAEEVTAVLVAELRDRLGRLWDERRITFRTGSPLRVEHLRRVDFFHASVIIVPGADFAAGGARANDTRTIKALLSLTNHPARGADGELPLAVAEIFDARNLPVARRAYDGPIEVLASDVIVSRLIAQNVRHRGLSRVYGELLTHGRGNELYVREFPELTGAELAGLYVLFPRAVLCGLVRPEGASFRPCLNRHDDLRLEAGDRLVFLARNYEQCVLATRSAPPRSGGAPATASTPGLPTTRAAGADAERARVRRVLILGWSHKVPALLQEFGAYRNERFEVDVLSAVPPEERRQALRRYDVDLPWLQHLEGDYTSASQLARVQPGSYDNLVLLGSDWLQSSEESDARTILGYLLVRELVPDAAERPEVLVELLDGGNVSLLRQKAGEVLISPVILSHMLSQVALRRELRAVFDELFGSGGAEIAFRSVDGYGLVGAELSFAQVQETAAGRGETALGVRVRESAGAGGGERTLLNPAREARWAFGPTDDVVVLTTY